METISIYLRGYCVYSQIRELIEENGDMCSWMEER